MQRHLALLAYLFPLPKHRPPEEESADVLLDRAKRHMQEAHARHREQVVVAMTAKNNLQNQVDDLQKTIWNLQEKADKAVGRGERALADKLLREIQSYEESLQSASETLVQAEETCEQFQTAIKREEEWIRQKTAEALALKAKWKQSEIAIAMEEELRQIEIWHLTQPPQPQIDRKTARELVGFLLLLLLVVIAVLFFR